MKLRRRSIPTLSESIKRYLTEISVLKKGLGTEQAIARCWQATRLAGRPIDRIKNTDLIALRDAWLETLAPATVVRRLAFVSHVFTVLRKDWGFDDIANPAQLVRRPTVRDGRERRIHTTIQLRGISEVQCPRDELTWILNHTESDELPIIMRLAVESAMRRSEIVKIKREHIDLRYGTVYLPETKNGTPRTVPLSPAAIDELRTFLIDRPIRGYVFTTSAAGVTRAFVRARQRARKAYVELCRRYGRRPHPDYLVGLRFHDLRHEATSILAAIFDVHTLAKITGHKDTRMLLRYYHPDVGELARKLARSPHGRAQMARIRARRQALQAP